ncbi:hypothetical protein [Bosea sp. NBC_00550]|uniref:hypothetical protein n=1 Tax=Bosea sp. NBC_00550 TaxID=2969621 RepID=UPI002230E4E5|nr:hypothetical protein [Bosea sp. NBC_00550]UZF93564.1 hypothetical protein NWE53_05020 [Bosea sp. NBC_00550]
MKRSTYRAIAILLCSIMAALSLYFVSRLNWIALPLGLAAALTAFMIGRASAWAAGLIFLLALIGYWSPLPYYIDLAASRVLPLEEAKMVGGGALRGNYLLNSGFLRASSRLIVIEGDVPALDDLQRRPAFYLPELTRGACRNKIIRLTNQASVVDTRCDDAGVPDK